MGWFLRSTRSHRPTSCKIADGENWADAAVDPAPDGNTLADCDDVFGAGTHGDRFDRVVKGGWVRRFFA